MANVLVVDDTVDTVTLLVGILKQQGHAVSTAHNGCEALQVASVERPDAILLDIMMPGMDGIEVCRRLKASPDTNTIPVILLTAKDTDEDVVAGLDAGADDYVRKPFNTKVLAARICAAIRSKESHDALVRMNEKLRTEVTKRWVVEERLRAQGFVLRSAHEETIRRLVGASMWRDVETGMHIKRTGMLSRTVAKAVGWSSADAEMLQFAALHDVGKVGIPDAILRKPGKLSDDEFQTIKTHTVISARMLANSSVPMLQMAYEIALYHHEHWDGSGYPTGIAGMAIPEGARILAIIDVYDALTHDRVYRPALLEEEALQMMQREGGSHFDPLLLTAFFTQLPEIRLIARENPDPPPTKPFAVGPSVPGSSDSSTATAPLVASIV